MKEDRGNESPAPTIVGPRPGGAGTERRDVPRGIERLLLSARLDADERAAILADPVAAAWRAGVDLSASERAILAAVPRTALEEMIRSFGTRAAVATAAPTPSASVAAAALLATALGGCDQAAPPHDQGPASAQTQTTYNPATEGVRPAGAPIVWTPALEEAQRRATQSRQGIMLVLLATENVEDPHHPSRGVRPDLPAIAASRRLVQIFDEDRGVRDAVWAARLIAVRITEPVGADRHAFDELLERFDLARADLPAIVFVGPDAAVLGRFARAADPRALVQAIRAIPRLVGDPHAPVPAGSRPDRPR